MNWKELQLQPASRQCFCYDYIRTGLFYNTLESVNALTYYIKTFASDMFALNRVSVQTLY